MRRTLTILMLLGAALLPAAPAAGQTAPAPLLTARFDADNSDARTVRFGRGATIVGHLEDEYRRDVQAAEIVVTSQVLADGAKVQYVGSAFTDQYGDYEIDVPKGPSRRLTFTYRVNRTDPTPAAEAQATLYVLADASFGATPNRLRNGQSMVLGGQLRGRPVPEGGKLVELQVYKAGRWRTFVVVRAREGNGRFSYRYRFQSTLRTTTYRFRALVPVFSSYPYVRGASRAVRVRVRAR